MYEENENSWYTAPEPVQQEKKEKSGMSSGKVIALTLCCSLIAGALGGGGMYLGMSKAGPAAVQMPEAVQSATLMQGERDPLNIEYASVNTDGLMSAADVYEQNVGSTVGIRTSITTTNYWGYQSTAAASGSGFIVTEDGYIVTNYHVIEGANSVTVTDNAGESYDAVVVGYDDSNDLAVLKVEATGLRPVIFGNSDELRVGDTVVAIGNPLGELTFSMTGGLVSALDRQITTSGGIMRSLIQTDCAINSGNSGGALFNLHGEVIGITNAKYSGSSGSGASIDNIGFAIPISHVRGTIESIIEKGYATKPYIGVTIQPVSAEAQSYGIPAGVAVASVTEGGPADKAGLMEKDIITAVDGEAVTANDDVVSRVTSGSPGDKRVLTVYRQGENLEITVTIGEQMVNTK